MCALVTGVQTCALPILERLAEKLIAEVGIGGAEAQRGGDDRNGHAGDERIAQPFPDQRVGGDRLVPLHREATERQRREAVLVERENEARRDRRDDERSEEQTYELQTLKRNSNAAF